MSRFPAIRKKELFIQLSRMWPQLLESHIKILRGLKRWDEGRWGKGNKPQYNRIYNRDPLAHLDLSHLLSPLRYSIPENDPHKHEGGSKCTLNVRPTTLNPHSGPSKTSLNPKPSNPKPLHPEPLNYPKPLNP